MALGELGPAASRDLYRVPGTHRIWCDGSRGKKEWSISYQSEKKKELALLVRGHLFSEFYTRQGCQPLLAALAGRRVDEDTLGLQHQPINRARRPTKNPFT